MIANKTKTKIGQLLSIVLISRTINLVTRDSFASSGSDDLLLVVNSTCRLAEKGERQ